MTPREVAENLATLMPRPDSDRPALRIGTRVSISLQGLTAFGTVIGASITTPKSALCPIELDGTGQRIMVPWDLIGAAA